MENIRRGNIYWIERSQYKTEVGSVQLANRPGIIVSCDANNQFASTVEIVYLTTAPKNDLPTHCIIRSATEPSTALCEQVTTVSTEQIGRFIGQCTLGEMAQIDACICVSLDLDGKIMARPSKSASTQQKTIDRMNGELAQANERAAKAEAELEALKARYEELEKAKAEMTDMAEKATRAQDTDAKSKKLEKLTAELVRAKAREEVFAELYHELKEQMLKK